MKQKNCSLFIRPSTSAWTVKQCTISSQPASEFAHQCHWKRESPHQCESYSLMFILFMCKEHTIKFSLPDNCHTWLGDYHWTVHAQTFKRVNKLLHWMNGLTHVQSTRMTMMMLAVVMFVLIEGDSEHALKHLGLWLQSSWPQVTQELERRQTVTWRGTGCGEHQKMEVGRKQNIILQYKVLTGSWYLVAYLSSSWRAFSVTNHPVFLIIWLWYWREERREVIGYLFKTHMYTHTHTHTYTQTHTHMYIHTLTPDNCLR